MDLVFISHITPEVLSIKIESISNAANYYQLKVEKALEPKLLISILPLPAMGVSIPPAFNSNGNRVFLNGRSSINKFSKIIIDTYDSIKLIGFRNDVLFYSLNIQTIVIFWISKIILRNRNYIIIADFEVSGGFNNPLRSLFQTLINCSYRLARGTLVLNKNINVNRNSVVCNALIDQNELVKISAFSVKSINNKILFSGSIGLTTGVDVAIKAMDFLPSFQLFITGKLYDIDNEEMEILIEKSKYKNVFFLGNLSYSEYLLLLNQCYVTLSLRNPEDVQHFYNFPSKIVEYLSFNKFVITTIDYGKISNNLLVSNFSAQSVSDVISTLDSMICEDSRSIVIDKFGFKSFKEKVIKLLNGDV